jgi:hypothetical protein
VIPHSSNVSRMAVTLNVFRCVFDWFATISSWESTAPPAVSMKERDKLRERSLGYLCVKNIRTENMERFEGAQRASIRDHAYKFN